MVLVKNPYSLPRSAYGGAGKRLFIGLMSAACAVLVVLIGVLWLIPLLDVIHTHPAVMYPFACVGAGLVSGLLFLCLLIIYQVYTGSQWLGRFGARGFVIRLLLPLMELLGRAVGIDKRIIRLSFIKINNELVLSSCVRCTPDKLLVLLPHCLQQSQCPYRLHTNVRNCHRCGRCTIGPLLELADTLGVHIYVASGGTLARRLVSQLRPRVIVAVACERDLTSGIQDAYPIPVFGCLNERPNGSCLDTRVEVATVERMVRHFLDMPATEAAHG